VISRDRYLKRDELGVIYQLCVAPGHQRGLIGASLIKEVFARSAYGCRLYCCWCAQDLDANYFWESLGFVPIAFRAGSTGKKRVHIFWQRRVDRDDQSAQSSRRSRTIGNRQSQIPYWYPFQTNSGAIREDRIVFPIPPGVHWSEVRAVEVVREKRTALKVLGTEGKAGTKQSRGQRTQNSALGTQHLPGMVGILVGGRIRYVARPGYVPPVEEKKAKAKREPKEKAPRARIDPKYLAAARELRDRALEHFNGRGDDALVLPAPAGKYDVSRALGAPTETKSMPLLITAA
jgi:hypothetical protein